MPGLVRKNLMDVGGRREFFATCFGSWWHKWQIKRNYARLKVGVMYADAFGLRTCVVAMWWLCTVEEKRVKNGVHEMEFGGDFEWLIMQGRKLSCGGKVVVDAAEWT